MTSPIVTVLMPVYNGGSFLAEAVESILGQTFTDFEFIIINDGSSDGSEDILLHYERLDERVHVYQQENRGLIASLNRGLDLARGKYLARMDADDISLPHRLARQVEILEQQPDLVILGSTYEVINETGKCIGVTRPLTFDTAIRWEMLFQCAFAHPSVMFRLNVLCKQRLAYDPGALHAEDYELWSRLLEYGQGMNCSEILIRRRVHDQQVGKTSAEQQQNTADEVARANLVHLGIELSISDVRIMRRWYGHFPSRLSKREIGLCPRWFEIIRIFSSRPGLDLAIWKSIRGRWVARIMLARSVEFTWPWWKMRLLWNLQLDDIKTMMSYLWHGLRCPNYGLNQE